MSNVANAIWEFNMKRYIPTILCISRSSSEAVSHNFLVETFRLDWKCNRNHSEGIPPLCLAWNVHQLICGFALDTNLQRVQWRKIIKPRWEREKIIQKRNSEPTLLGNSLPLLNTHFSKIIRKFTPLHNYIIPLLENNHRTLYAHDFLSSLISKIQVIYIYRWKTDIRGMGRKKNWNWREKKMSSDTRVFGCSTWLVYLASPRVYWPRFSYESSLFLFFK